MKHTTLTEWLVSANLQDIYCAWGAEELDGLWTHYGKIVNKFFKWAVLFNGDYYITADNFKRYQELIDVAIALNLDTEPHEFDSVEYAGCLEEGSLIQLPEPTVFALFFRDGELQVLNYSLMVYLSKKDCTEADLDQAIAYFSNLQQQSAEQAKKILLSV